LLILVLINFSSIKLYSQWVQLTSGISSNKSVTSFASKGNYIFAGTKYSGIYRSSNNGNSWSQINLTSYTITSLLVYSNNIFAATSSNGLWFSFGYGEAFSQFFPYSLAGNNPVIASSSTNRFYSGSDRGVYLTSNGGVNWYNTLTGNLVICLTTQDEHVFAGTHSQGIYHSINNGQSWDYNVPFSDQKIRALASNGTVIYAGKNDGVWRSFSSGIVFEQTTLNNFQVYSIYAQPNATNLIAGTKSGGVYFSTDEGDSWVQKNDGLPALYTIQAVFMKDNFVFIGTDSASIWRRPFTDFTGVTGGNNTLPNAYKLYQNYPNPFNPTTNIKYQISNNSFVSLNIYDALGRNIETLVNDKQSHGTYEVSWDASKYPSGIYFYKLTAGEFSEVRKMILVK